jgi:hypothetical protein
MTHPAEHCILVHSQPCRIPVRRIHHPSIRMHETSQEQPNRLSRSLILGSWTKIFNISHAFLLLSEGITQ